MESVQAAIGPLADFTDMLSGEEQVTLSAVRAVLHILRTEVLVNSSGDTMLTRDMKSSILAYMESKFSDSDLSELLDVASYLDPHFMTDYTGKAGLDIVRERQVDEGMEYENPVMRQRTNPETEDISELTEPAAKRKKLGSWLKKAKQSTSTASSQPDTPREAIEKEVAWYEKATQPDSDSNPLEW